MTIYTTVMDSLIWLEILIMVDNCSKLLEVYLNKTLMSVCIATHKLESD